MMGYWAEVREIALKGLDLAAQNIKEGAAIAVEKGKEGMAYVQLKKDLILAQRKLHNLLADLGDVVCDLYKEKKDVYADAVVKETMDKILASENECKKIEAEIKVIGAKQ